MGRAEGDHVCGLLYVGHTSTAVEQNRTQGQRLKAGGGGFIGIFKVLGEFSRLPKTKYDCLKQQVVDSAFLRRKAQCWASDLED